MIRAYLQKGDQVKSIGCRHHCDKPIDFTSPRFTGSVTVKTIFWHNQSKTWNIEGIWANDGPIGVYDLMELDFCDRRWS